MGYTITRLHHQYLILSICFTHPLKDMPRTRKPIQVSSLFPTRKIRKECCTWAGSRDRKLIARDTRVRHNPIAQ
ncbi:hypothetical protein JHK82_026727 [Glycine max]|uniref:Uncharacterized protein n=2 Tax=Glycine subgen. Soja TaxID=1462606 RepID=K7LH04_SOYBN|nr:hypothetical protein JHK87_026610 [Glycine soja]KAG5002710.1 hypothetical protein JHK86_026849 [Glycine max]KAG5125892.1 hypothetical protein JHK82_026727 [Glycine max]KAG5150485.1 hypothetical protein JHK84_026957 [Glycine max]KAH1136396.1 hypothetical protein GYH30_026746 [Glycine max]